MPAAHGLALKAVALFGTIVGLSAFLAVAYVDNQPPILVEGVPNHSGETAEPVQGEEVISRTGCKELEFLPEEFSGEPEEVEVLPAPKPAVGDSVS